MDLTFLQAIAALLTAIGAGTALPALAKGVMSHWSGKAERERTATQHAIAERDDAWDSEALVRDRLTVIKEYASRLRRQLIEAGIEPEPWPPKSNPTEEGP